MSIRFYTRQTLSLTYYAAAWLFHTLRHVYYDSCHLKIPTGGASMTDNNTYWINQANKGIESGFLGPNKTTEFLKERLPAIPSKYSYPVITTDTDEDGVGIFFPDLNLYGFAEDQAEMQEILAGWIEIQIEDGKQLPQSTPIEKLKLQQNQKVIMITVSDGQRF